MSGHLSGQRSQRVVQLGLVGQGIGASLTPAMQEREGRWNGLDLHYGLLDADRLGISAADLPALLLWARRLGYAGLNITHPFKQAVVALLEEVSQDAADLGAVNTVIFRDGRAVGANTDWSGYGRAFRAALPEAVHDRAVLVGAGGAGSAVGYALLHAGAEHVAVVDADRERAAACVSRLAARFGQDRISASDDLPAALAGADGVVNATPLGMHGHPGSSVPAELLHERLWVSDVVYFPLETELVSNARARGCRVLPGGGMAVGQAVGAFELFTGLAADAGRVEQHFLELTGSRRPANPAVSTALPSTASSTASVTPAAS
ncbi:shikimate dehydrogenase [Quadrisphaera granulorum]|uniref:Quinate/shikimate dehydrogenase (NAD(+)) n=1 Tax=Quadrisphaera granulorum TaxID=317664 RepID=A0A316AGN5_9ACTN|nr:shikimate dehydrogenase [Quadrisphaera granulorum]PWJ56100.1 shikimate dehydrogenase [Quadrisphaera granulorum]SZE94734.1 shikimate dehydrogenase [Quadrisphaera granulorum]